MKAYLHDLIRARMHVFPSILQGYILYIVSHTSRVVLILQHARLQLPLSVCPVFASIYWFLYSVFCVHGWWAAFLSARLPCSITGLCYYISSWVFPPHDLITHAHPYHRSASYWALFSYLSSFAHAMVHLRYYHQCLQVLLISLFLDWVTWRTYAVIHHSTRSITGALLPACSRLSPALDAIILHARYGLWHYPGITCFTFSPGE